MVMLGGQFNGECFCYKGGLFNGGGIERWAL